MVVHGAAVSTAVTFSHVTYGVTFTESGLPSGMEWGVDLTTGQTFRSTSGTLTFREPNGTYTYTVGSVTGYTSNVTSGDVIVQGESASVSVIFASTSGGNGGGSSLGGLTTTEWILIGAVIVVAAGVGAVFATRRKRSKGPSPPPSGGTG